MRQSDPPLGLQLSGMSVRVGDGRLPSFDRRAVLDVVSPLRQDVSGPAPSDQGTAIGATTDRESGIILAIAVGEGVFGVYRLGVGLGTTGLLLFGGFVPVVRAWLNDSVLSWSDVVIRLGGAPIRMSRVDPDADFGPILKRSEAPRLFDILAEVANQLEAPPAGSGSSRISPLLRRRRVGSFAGVVARLAAPACARGGRT